MATSLLPAFALGPVNLLGQALVKFHLATAVPCWLYMVIEPFLRAESMSPCSTSLRHFHMSMASVMPRLSVMLFHFRRPGTFLMTNSPLGPLALYSTTSFSLPSPVHSRNAPTTCPWNSTPNHAETNGSDIAICHSFFQMLRFARTMLAKRRRRPTGSVGRRRILPV